MENYAAMVTSDWSECLSPSGPFDMITFHYPHLKGRVEEIFRGYTGNDMTLAQAAEQIGDLLPSPIRKSQMDAYLEAGFAVYADVAAFMNWCRRRQVLFMINSTGAVGYFQRVFARGELATADVLAAHPMIQYPGEASDPKIILPIQEISDKPVHSAAMAKRFGIPPERVVVIGDSGGDGPHFEWGAEVGATLVASLAKPSLLAYCRRRKIELCHHWDPGTDGRRSNGSSGISRMNLDGLCRLIDRLVRC